MCQLDDIVSNRLQYFYSIYRGIYPSDFMNCYSLKLIIYKFQVGFVPD